MTSDVVMRYTYRGWIIDATPDFSLGKFFAHARITQASPDNVDVEVHHGRDLAWFDDEDEAVEFAHKWAVIWIDTRETGHAGLQAD